MKASAVSIDLTVEALVLKIAVAKYLLLGNCSSNSQVTIAQIGVDKCRPFVQALSSSSTFVKLELD